MRKLFPSWQAVVLYTVAIVGIWVLTLPIPAVHARDFAKTFSVTGGTPQRLSSILIGAGYLGVVDQVHVITICVPDANVNTLYLGQSNVSASNGFAIPPGACDTLTGSSTVPIQTSSLYLFIATTENESFQVHGQ